MFIVFSIILMSFGGKSNPDFATFFVVYIKNTKIRFFIGNRWFFVLPHRPQKCCRIGIIFSKRKSKSGRNRHLKPSKVSTTIRCPTFALQKFYRHCSCRKAVVAPTMLLFVLGSWAFGELCDQCVVEVSNDQTWKKAQTVLLIYATKASPNAIYK